MNARVLFGFAAIGVVLHIVGGAAWAQSMVTRSMALSGTDGNLGPGLGMGAEFLSFGPAQVDRDGRVGFTATLAGPATWMGNDEGVWFGPPFELSVVLREGSVLPGVLATETHHAFESIAVNGGRIAVVGRVGAVFPQSAVLWIGVAGGMTMISRNGVAPNPGPVLNGIFLWPTMNDAGQAVLSGNGAAGQTNIWVGTAGALVQVTTSGALVPEVPGASYRLFDRAVMSGGHIAMFGTIAGPGFSGANGNVLWMKSGASPRIVARTSDAAPGTEPGTVYSWFESTQSVNQSGSVVFEAGLSGPSVNLGNEWAIYCGQPTNVGLVARTGNAAAGLGAGVVYGDLGSPALNRNGVVAFSGIVMGPGFDDTAPNCVWVGQPQDLHVIASATETPPPGDGPWFESFTYAVSLNGADQVVFGASMRTGVPPGFANKSLWVFDPATGLRMIVRAGDRLVTGDGSVRTVQTLNYGGELSSDDSRGRGTSLCRNDTPTSAEDAGWFVYTAAFTDGSRGVVRVALPGPARCGLADIANEGAMPGYDGVISVDDLIMFLSAFFGQEYAVADVAALGGTRRADGQIGVDDIVAFIAAFFAGCG